MCSLLSQYQLRSSQVEWRALAGSSWRACSTRCARWSRWTRRTRRTWRCSGVRTSAPRSRSCASGRSRTTRRPSTSTPTRSCASLRLLLLARLHLPAPPLSRLHTLALLVSSLLPALPSPPPPPTLPLSPVPITPSCLAIASVWGESLESRSSSALDFIAAALPLQLQLQASFHFPCCATWVRLYCFTLLFA